MLVVAVLWVWQVGAGLQRRNIIDIATHLRFLQLVRLVHQYRR